MVDTESFTGILFMLAVIIAAGALLLNTGDNNDRSDITWYCQYADGRVIQVEQNDPCP